MKKESSRPESLLKFSLNKKLPVVLQTESSECGLACLSMIAQFYDLNIDLLTLRHSYSISSRGATLKQIMNIASKLHMSSRALRLEVEQLEQLQTPCILHWEMKHFVVLRKVHKNKLIIHDPAIGEYEVDLNKASNLFTGVALELTPTPEFEKKEYKNTLRIEQFWSRIIGLKRSLLVVFLLALLMQLFAIISPFYMQTVVDDVIVRKDFNLLSVLALGFALLLLIQTGTNFLRELVLLRFSNKLNIQMSSNVFHHLIRLPMSYFAKRHIGDVISRFGALSKIRQLFTTSLIATVVDGIMSAITIVVMFFYDSTLAFIVLGVVFIYGCMRYTLYNPVHLLNEELIISSAKESSFFMESIRGIQTIKLFGKETDRQNQWLSKFADSTNKGIKIAKWNLGFSTANKLLFGLENIIIVYLSANAVMQNLMSVGMLYAFLSYKGRFINSTNSLIERWIEFRMLSLHLDRLSDIVFSEKDKLLTDQEKKPKFITDDEIKAITGKITLSNVSYAYSDLEDPILKKVNLTINSGETVAIIGSSGSGKTTLIKIMMGLISPSEGSLLYDDKPIEEIFNYRQQISAVMQDNQLLSGSLAENIACFSSNIDMKKVYSCAAMACIENDIRKMPMQFNTLIGDMGSGLSGGQQQRIAIARAFYRNPKILFMDEATSHLDIKNEERINDNLASLGITRVIAAHRLETILMAHRIFEVKNGEVYEIDKSVLLSRNSQSTGASIISHLTT